MMNCQQVRPMIHAYVDGELDVAQMIEMEQHVSQCASCGELDRSIRALRTVVSTQAPYYKAPQHLRELPQAVVAARTTSTAARFPKSGMLTVACLLLVGAIGFWGGMLSNPAQKNYSPMESVVVAHIRSLQVEHAVDVVSTDRHTVKPWFQGRLDYSPLVVDLSEKGFKLSGGRLDYLTDRPIAAIVYYRRSHAINLFCWPSSTDGESSLRRLATQGFHLRNWQSAGMTYWAISDLNDKELDQFVELIKAGNPPGVVE